MNRNLLRVLGIALILVFFASSGAFFVVDETQTALVLQLGKPVGGVKGPGLHFKIPVVQNVVTYDARYLEYDASARELITRD